MRDPLSTVQITLAGDAYNPRTKGAVKQILEKHKAKFTTLGNGRSFTGFIVEINLKSNAEKQMTAIIADINQLSTAKDITFQPMES